MASLVWRILVSREDITAVGNVIRENRRVTIKEVASLMDTGVGSAHHIVCDELKFRKVCASLVPKRLTPEMKDVSMLVKRFCVGMMGMVKHFSSESSLGMRIGYTSTNRNTKHGVVPHLVPKHEEGAGATICRQTHVDYLLGLERADLRALHAQRKHCDQCHLLNPEGKSEASYSPEKARVVDDGSASPPRKCEATYCYSQCRLLRSCYLSSLRDTLSGTHSRDDDEVRSAVHEWLRTRSK